MTKLPRPPAIVVAHPGAEMYGSDRMMLEDVKGLVQDGWAVTAALPSEGPLADALRKHGAQVTFSPTPVLRKSIFSPRGAMEFIRDIFSGIRATRELLKTTKPRAVLVNTTIIPLWVFYSRLSGHKVVLHVHESESHSPFLMRIGLSFPGCFANHIITNSKFTSNAYLKYTPWVKKKTSIVYNGIPGPEQTHSPRTSLNAPVKLLYVGRLSERKGLLTLISAMGILEENDVNVELSLVGAVFEGYESFERELRNKVSTLTDPQRVIFHGYQTDVWRFYQQADIALVPALMEESFGNTAVEAILASRPVIVSNIGGLKEAAENYSSSILTEPGNAEQLAEAIKEIVHSWEDYRQAAKESAEEARRRHNPELFGSSVAEIIRSAIN